MDTGDTKLERAKALRAKALRAKMVEEQEQPEGIAQTLAEMPLTGKLLSAGYGITDKLTPGMGTIRNAIQSLAKKTLGGSESENLEKAVTEENPISNLIGSIAPDIARTVAGGAALKGVGTGYKAARLLGGKGRLSGGLREALSNVAVQQGNRGLKFDPTAMGLDAILGAGGALVGGGFAGGKKALKWGANKALKTIFKRGSKEVAEEIKNEALKQILKEGGEEFFEGGVPVEEAILKQGRIPWTLKGMVKDAIKRGREVMPERNAIIEGIEQTNPSTVTKYIRQLLKKLNPADDVFLPGGKPAAKAASQYIDDTMKYLKAKPGGAGTEALKEEQAYLARKLFEGGKLSPMENIGKQLAKKTSQGAREALEEAAGESGARLRELNKIYGTSSDIKNAAADALSRTGKGGILTAILGTAGLSGAMLGEKYANHGELATPVIGMALLASPVGRLMLAKALSAAGGASGIGSVLAKGFAPAMSTIKNQ